MYVYRGWLYYLLISFWNSESEQQMMLLGVSIGFIIHDF